MYTPDINKSIFTQNVADSQPLLWFFNEKLSFFESDVRFFSTFPLIDIKHLIYSVELTLEAERVIYNLILRTWTISNSGNIS